MVTTIDLTPEVINLKLYAGDGTIVTFTVTDSDDQPVDLSGREWTSQWRRSRKSDSAIDLEVDATQAAVGVFRVIFAGEDTALMVGTGVWDVQGTPNGSEPDTLVTGDVITTADVTR